MKNEWDRTNQRVTEERERMKKHSKKNERERKHKYTNENKPMKNYGRERTNETERTGKNEKVIHQSEGTKDKKPMRNNKPRSYESQEEMRKT